MMEGNKVNLNTWLIVLQIGVIVFGGIYALASMDSEIGFLQIQFSDFRKDMNDRFNTLSNRVDRVQERTLPRPQ